MARSVPQETASLVKFQHSPLNFILFLVYASGFAAFSSIQLLVEQVPNRNVDSPRPRTAEVK